METILVVDDEKNYLLVMAALLSDQGFEVLTAENGVQALEVIDETDLELVLTDMKMPQMDGIDLLTRITKLRPELPVIVMTAFGTVEKAVEAMKTGAFDYITKPFQNEELMLTIQKALDMHRLVRVNRELTQELRQRDRFENIISKNRGMRAIFRLIEKVADTQANVLITGESGTGKELIARAIHQGNRERRNRPFITINCAALPETLLESELFGHEKGAFTGAVASRKGRFELSDRGTIFLDEIGDMSPPLQAKLLRVIQEREFERVGGSKTIKVDVRLVAASNRDLKQEVSAGRFREDLLYRLNVVHIHLPTLRERADDIPLLVDHFVRIYEAKDGRADLKVSPEAMRRIYSYHWPGNVRELENIIERALVISRGNKLELGDWFSKSSGSPNPAGVVTLEERERQHIMDVLELTGWRVSGEKGAAKLLGINPKTLESRMRKLNVKRAR